MRIASALLVTTFLVGCVTKVSTPALPDGFVHLSQVVPTIRQGMRYATRTNFMGRKIDGYQAGACILTRPAADALKIAQADVMRDGLTLVVFDCYRPARAVTDFMRWTRTPGPADPVWRPTLPKDRLVPDGYIAARSGHSRGSTIDLGLARLDTPINDTRLRTSPCARTDANTLDFGTPFDCFDPASATASLAISPAARVNRDRLQAAMNTAGFRNYPAEWWHFTLINESNKTDIFDFPVTAPAR